MTDFWEEKKLRTSGGQEEGHKNKLFFAGIYLNIKNSSKYYFDFNSWPVRPMQ